MRKIAVLGVALLLTVAVSSCSLMRRATDEGAGGYSSSKPSATSTRTSSPRATWTPATRTPQTSSTSTSASPAGETSVHITQIKVGDCFGSMSGSSVTNVPKVPCNQPHYWEVYSLKTVASTTYPGDSEIRDQAKTHCGVAFLSYVGITPGKSELSVTYSAPSPSSWKLNNRQIKCFAGLRSGGLEGSIKGSKR